MSQRPLEPIPDRLDRLDEIHLDRGRHGSFDDGTCLMELTSWLAGEPWSDHPQCVSLVIGAFLRGWSDDLDDDTRQTLKVYAPRAIGTASTPDVESRRAWMVTDWMVRTYLPAWLRLARMAVQADAVASLGELTDAFTWGVGRSTVEIACRQVYAAEDAAGDAARDAARDAAARVAARVAAGDAAGDAARDAAEDAAWYAAGAAAGDAARDAAGAAARVAARVAAGDAAWYAAGAAAEDAAWYAAGDAAARVAARVAADAAAGAAARVAAGAAAGVVLRPTVVGLQASARDLIDRLLAVTADGTRHLGPVSGAVPGVAPI